MRSLINTIPDSLKQMVIYGSAIVTAKMMSLLMVPVFTHFLSPEDFGRLDVLQTLANLLSIVITFGLGQSLFRFSGSASDAEARTQVAARILGLAAGIACVAFLLTQAFAGTIAALLPGGVSETQTRLILISLAVSGVRLVPMSWLRLSNRAYAYLMASAGCAVAQALLSALLLYLGYGLEGILASGAITLSAFALYLSVCQSKATGIERPSRSDFGQYGHFGGVLMLAGIAGFVMDSFPRWILAGSVGPAEMAVFALAAKFALMTGFLIQPFMMWWLPRRFKVLGEHAGDIRAAHATESGVVVALVAAVLVAAASPLLIVWMTPDAYHGATEFVPALCFLAALNGSIRLLNLGALSKDKTLWPIYIDVTAALLACAGYVLTVPAYGGWAIVGVTAIILVLRITAYILAGQACRPLPYAYGKMALLAALSASGITAISYCPSVEAMAFVGSLAALLMILTALLIGLILRPAWPIAPFVARYGKSS